MNGIWIAAVLVVLLYVHLFKIVAPMYLDSGRTLTIFDLWGIVKTNLGLVD
jgi:hypothetical protein